MSTKTVARIVATATLAVSGVALSAPAQAAWSQERAYWTDTYSRCTYMQQAYTSSWTKITRPCYRNGSGWSFHYRVLT